MKERSSAETSLRITLALGAVMGPVTPAVASTVDSEKAIYREVGDLRDTNPYLTFPDQLPKSNDPEQAAAAPVAPTPEVLNSKTESHVLINKSFIVGPGIIDEVKQAAELNGGLFITPDTYLSLIKSPKEAQEFQDIVNSTENLIASALGIDNQDYPQIEARFTLIETGKYSMYGGLEYRMPDGSLVVPYIDQAGNQRVYMYSPRNANEEMGSAAVMNPGGSTRIVPMRFEKGIPESFLSVGPDGAIMTTPVTQASSNQEELLYDSDGNILVDTLGAGVVVEVLQTSSPLVPLLENDGSISAYVDQSHLVVQENIKIIKSSVEYKDTRSPKEKAYDTLPKEYKQRVTLPEGDPNRIAYSENELAFVDTQGRIFRPETVRNLNNPEDAWTVEMDKETYELIDKNGQPFTWTIAVERTANAGLGITESMNLELNDNFKHNLEQYSQKYFNASEVANDTLHVTFVRSYEKTTTDSSFNTYLQHAISFDGPTTFMAIGYNAEGNNKFVRLYNGVMNTGDVRMHPGDTQLDVDASYLSQFLSAAVITYSRAAEHPISMKDVISVDQDLKDRHLALTPNPFTISGFKNSQKLVNIN